MKKDLKEALFWEPSSNKEVVCKLCNRFCKIPEGKTGVCRVRKNINGVLYSLVYGLLTALNTDPIEKKPLFHFYPGSNVLSISTVGCNFKCRFCLNWNISQEKEIIGEKYTPKEVVSTALKGKADGISYTYNEPTVFYEFMLDTSVLSKKEGLFNTIVTNGYMTPEAVEKLAPYLDAATVDLKGSGDPNFYKRYMGVDNPSPIYETIKKMVEEKIHVEITDLIVPEVGDNFQYIEKMLNWVLDNLGEDTPVHFLRFHPDYLMTDKPSTPVKTLEKAANLAFKKGLKYVYIGNVWGHKLENTFCPNCGEKVIGRLGFTITDWGLDEKNNCSNCGEKINVVGKYKETKRSYWIF